MAKQKISVLFNWDVLQWHITDCSSRLQIVEIFCLLGKNIIPSATADSNHGFVHYVEELKAIMIYFL